MFLSRTIEGTIKTVTIRRSSTGKWFVAFSCDDVPAKELPETAVEVGIDVGISSFKFKRPDPLFPAHVISLYYS